MIGLTPLAVLGVATAIFCLEIAAQRSWIATMKRVRIAQVQKAYGPGVDAEVKAQVPSMGGLVFMVIGSGLLISAMLSGQRQAMAFWTYPLLAAAVGLLDDLLKFRRNSSEGLKSLQKLFLQVVTTMAWLFQLAAAGIVPPLALGFSIGPWVWPWALFFAVGIQNAVNVTDGLDGLASGCAVVTFALSLSLWPGDSMAFTGAAVGLALSSAFLWHNGHPAQVFMGDGGAHYLAGLMVSCAFTGSGVLALIPLGLGFGLEMLSVVIQLAAIYGFRKKIFLMSPVHHHFQLLGWPETRIVTRFWLIHGVGALVCTGIYLYLQRLISL